MFTVIYLAIPKLNCQLYQQLKIFILIYIYIFALDNKKEAQHSEAIERTCVWYKKLNTK